MSSANISNFVTFLSALLTLAGATGITATDVQGFVTVAGAFVTLGAVVVSWILHNKAIVAARAGRA